MTRASTYTLARGGLVLFLAAFHTGTLVGAQTSSPTYLTPANTPFSSPQIVTISGLNFQATDKTPSVLFGTNYVCGTTSWSSATTVQCAPGLVAKTNFVLSQSVSLKDDTGTVTAISGVAFTFDAAVTSFALGYNNGQYSGGSSVTITGMNFGGVDASPSVVLRTICATSAWSSSTTLQCLSASVSGPQYFVHKNTGVYNAVGTIPAAIFSFDGPVITAGSMNSPTSGGASLTMSGTAFGLLDYTPTAALDNAVCLSTSWTSQTQLRCAVPQTSSAPASPSRSRSAPAYFCASVGFVLRFTVTAGLQVAFR